MIGDKVQTRVGNDQNQGQHAMHEPTGERSTRWDPTILELASSSTILLLSGPESTQRFPHEGKLEITRDQ